MDILAAVLAYLMSVAAIVGALGISFVVFFATPGQQPWLLREAKAPLVAPGAVKTTAANVKEPAQSEQIDENAASGVAQGQAAPVRTIAVEMQRNSSKSIAWSRRLAARERARRLAYREDSFETRFLRNEN